MTEIPTTCQFSTYGHKCGKPVEHGSLFCERHKKAKCSSCGQPATHERCNYCGQFVCVAPLRDECTYGTDESKPSDRIRKVEAEIEQLRKERDEALDKLQDASMAGAAVHAIREMLNEIGVPQAAFIDDHVRNGLVWARRQALEEAAQVADDEAEIERSMSRQEAARSADYIAQRIRELKER